MVDTRFYKHLGPILLGELLDGLDVQIGEGQFTDILIENAAPVAKAGVADISYFESAHKNAQLDACGASACFVVEDNTAIVTAHGCFPIQSKHPRADFARILSRLYKPYTYGDAENPEFNNVQISRGVIIGPNAQIGMGTSIGPNTVIGPGVVIGENCMIGANVVIEFSQIGNNCNIHNGAIIGGTGFGVAVSATGGVDIPHVGRVILGNKVSVGCLTTIDRAMFGDTKIGDGCKFDNLVQIAHNTTIGSHSMFAAHVGIAGSCQIGSGVIMGGKAGVADHITIGDGVTLAAAAQSMHNIPAGEKWSGYPAMPIREHMRQINAVRKLVPQKKQPPKPTS